MHGLNECRGFMGENFRKVSKTFLIFQPLAGLTSSTTRLQSEREAKVGQKQKAEQKTRVAAFWEGVLRKPPRLVPRKWADPIARFFFAQNGMRTDQISLFFGLFRHFAESKRRTRDTEIAPQGDHKRLVKGFMSERMELKTENQTSTSNATPASLRLIGVPQHSQPHADLWSRITPLLETLGYELIHLEAHIGRQKILRLFIEHLEWSKGGIGIEDCAKVSRALDEALDTMEEVEGTFKGAYELEVSSPGVDRPLRNVRDFERFKGREVRLYLDRPLTAAEASNEAFCAKHPKQKTFLGISQGATAQGMILLDVMKDEGTSGKTKGRPSPASKVGKKGTESALPRITLPPELITKANLEPDYDASGTPVGEIEGGTEL